MKIFDIFHKSSIKIQTIIFSVFLGIFGYIKFHTCGMLLWASLHR